MLKRRYAGVPEKKQKLLIHLLYFAVTYVYGVVNPTKSELVHFRWADGNLRGLIVVFDLAELWDSETALTENHHEPPTLTFNDETIKIASFVNRVWRSFQLEA